MLARAVGTDADRILEVLPAGAIHRRAADLIASIKPRSLALSGGQTPRSTYQILAASAMEWERTHLLQVDERIVDREDPRSNWKMIEEALAGRVPAQSHPMPVDHAPDKCADVYEEVARRFRPLDLVVLGLGEDGHTASLFPNSPVLSSARLVGADVSRDPARLTLTLRCLNEARVAVFIVSGAEKSGAVSALMKGEDIPAARVRATGAVYVLADEEAASFSRPTS